MQRQNILAKMGDNYLTQLGPDIAMQMFAAVIEDDADLPQQETEIVSLEAQKSYLQRNIDSVGFLDRKAIGNIIVMNNREDLLHQCGEGTVINLDVLDEKITTQMYNLLYYKMNKQ